MKPLRLGGTVLCCVALISCGGGGASSGGSTAPPPPPPPQMVVTPADTTVLAGGTVQFKVTLGTTIPPVDWAAADTLNGTPTEGIISNTGLYTAPATPPFGEPVGISATTFNDQSGVTTVQVRYSKASLNGQYVFSFDEVAGGAETTAIGVFTADGDGGLTGTEDVNGPGGVFTAVPVTGQYTVGVDGEGSLTIQGTAGNLSLTFDLTSWIGSGNTDSTVGIANIGPAAFLVDATAGDIGSGALYAVYTGPFAPLSISGSYLLQLGSGMLAATDAEIGQVTLAGNSVSSGALDENDTGTYAHYATVTGSYTSPSSSRGTLTLSYGSFTRTFTYYAVSDGYFVLLDTDSGVVKRGILQSGGGSPGFGGLVSLMGTGTGNTPDALLTDADARLVTLSAGAESGTVSYFSYEDDDGTNYAGVTKSGAWSVDATGYGTLTLPAPSGNRSFAVYGPEWLETSASGAFAVGTTGGIACSAAVGSGEFAFSVSGQQAGSSTLITQQGILTITSGGAVSGTIQQDKGGALSSMAVSGALNLLNTPGIQCAGGIYTLTLDQGGVPVGTYFVAANNDGILTVLETDGSRVGSGSLIIQFGQHL